MRRTLDGLLSGALARAGVDARQWKALCLARLKLDFRGSAMGRSPFNREARFITAIIAQIVFYTVFGGALAILVWVTRDLFLVGAVTVTYVMLTVGLAVLLDHNTAIVSPIDYGILGFRPVSARTFLAVRLTNVLVYIGALTVVISWVPVVALFVRYGVVMGLAGIAATSAAALATTMAILAGYAAVLKLISPDAVQRALSYLQVVMTFAVYALPVFFGRALVGRLAVDAGIEKTAWMLLLPPVWFGSYLEIAGGRIGVREVVPAATSLAVLLALVGTMRGRLTLDYSERLGALTAARSRSTPRSADRPQRWFTAGEARAVALLVRGQFRNDQKFRMGVLAILPMTIFYILIAARDGGIQDPFVADDRRGFSPVAMALMMFPAMLKMQVTRSESFRAAWIFFTTPADRMKLVRSSITVVLVFFLVPYLLFVSAIYAFLVGNLPHVLVHFALFGLLGHFVLQVTILVEPELPFSRPLDKGHQSILLVAFTVVMGIVSAVLDTLSAQLYASTMATVLAFAGVVAASVVVDRLTRARVARRTASMEFVG